MSITNHETSDSINSVNHVGITVRNLENARKLYEKMGFTMTPLSAHSGTTKPGETEKTMATANHCAVFQNNYVEILGLVGEANDKSGFGWTGFLERFAGAHIICFGCIDAAAVAARLDQSNIGNSGAVVLKRDIETLEGVKTAIFDRVLIDSINTPEARRVQAAYHRFPELVHQARYMTHGNTAISLSEMMIACDDPIEMADKYSLLTGVPVSDRNNEIIIELPLVTTLRFVKSGDVVNILPGTLLPPSPAITSISFAVEDIEQARTVVSDAGFTVIGGKERFYIPAEEALGVVHEFMPVNS